MTSRTAMSFSLSQDAAPALSAELRARTSSAHREAFPGVRQATVKQQYRRQLDEAPFTAAERERLVEEALLAYRLNVAITAELDTDLPRWTAA